MKRTTILVLSAVCVSLAAFGSVPKHSATYYEAIKPEVQEAQRKGAKARLIYRVVDDEGLPITNTVARGTWRNDYPRKTWNKTFTTNENGEFVAEDKVGGAFGFYVKKIGYYMSSTGLNFHWREGVSPLVKDGKWQPYGEHRMIVLKRIKNPVEMKFHNWGIGGYRAPETNVWVGLDFEMGQWCKPYGNGEHEDVMVRFSGSIVDDFTWDTKTEISFTNIPYAGYYIMQKDTFSTMKTCYAALTNDSAYAERMLTLTSKGRRGIPPNREITDKIAADKYLVFRTRCTINENGRLVSAHYGKISGDFRGSLQLMFFTPNSYADEAGIYFNPTPNDTNLEDAQNVRRLKSQ